MNKRLLLSTAIAGFFYAGFASAELSLDANLELDTDVADTANTGSKYDQNGFVELNAYGKHQTGEYFVAAKGSVRLQSDGDDNVEVRDVYVQLGNNVWDAQLGRFEAVNLFPLAKDTVISHAGGVSVYEANKVRGRAGDDGGQIAFHLNASDNLKFEIATIFGDDDTAGDNGSAVSGIRPAVTWSTDGVSLTAGYERVNYDLSAGGEVDQNGFGITANFDVGEANFNVAASRMEDETTDQEVNSYVANVVYGGFGAGVIFSEEDNATGVDPEVTTTYLAYTMPLFDIESATVTFAGSFSTADDVADDESTALRMRLNYTF